MKLSFYRSPMGKQEGERAKSWRIAPFVIAFGWLFLLYLLSPMPMLALAQRLEGPPLDLNDAVELHGYIYSIWANLCNGAPPLVREFFDMQNQAWLRWL